VLFESSMVVEHPPRPFTVREWVRRGNLVREDWILYLRHPFSRPRRWPTRWAPLLRMSVDWLRMAHDPEVVRGSVRRASRLALIALGQLAVGGWVTLCSWRAVWAAEKLDAGDRSQEAGVNPALEGGARPHEQQALRIAYIGPTPRQGSGGASGSAWLILEQLAWSGVWLDCYLTVTDDQEQLDAIAKLPSARIIPIGSIWRFGRWYSRRDLTKMVSGLGVQALGRRRLVGLIAEQHEFAPYDALYQFSTIETFGRRKDRRRLPPIVLHPSVHAAGELRWLRKERELSALCDGRVRAQFVICWLWFRSRRQKRDIRRATVVLALSEVFGRHLVEDYGIEPARVQIAPNPIDLEGFRPLSRPACQSAKPLEIAMVGRLSVRKGLELIVQLSHRLRDLSGSVHLEIVGDRSQWSNYRRLLDDLDPTVASFRGALSHDGLKQWLPTCDLLVQPAKYEPFGLTVGEALASGVPVVVTTEVGAGEGVSETCCIRIPPGDLDALEEAVRGMVALLHSPAGALTRAAARPEAERLWSAASVGRQVEAALTQAAGLSAHRHAFSTVGPDD